MEVKPAEPVPAAAIAQRLLVSSSLFEASVVLKIPPWPWATAAQERVLGSIRPRGPPLSTSSLLH